jgi:peptidoglycan/xylan/chitin deacetylase (PgdA/CDA1 family)
MTLMQHFPRLARVRDRWSRAAIVMYHRVIALDCDPWGLAVAPDHFAQQLEYFKRGRTVLTMAEFVVRMQRDSLPRDAVAITFDDGYHDNYLNAAPMLEAAGLPATLFLSTAPTQRHEPYWFEELAAMVLDAAEPADFIVTLTDGPLLVSFGRREHADDDRRGWRASNPPRTKREALFYSSWKRMRALAPRDRDAAMANLRANLTAERSEVSRAMTVDEIRHLVASGLITLGGHTVDHPDLCQLQPEEALDQIARGKAETEAIAGTTIDGFAYPYGRTDDRVRALVIKAGFQWACTTEPGFVGASRTDQFAMPRIAAVDTTARPFDAYMARS